MADASPDLGSVGTGLGSLFGSLLGSGAALASTQAGIGAVGDLTQQGAAMLAPYNFTGASYLGPIASDLMSPGTASSNIGNARIGAAVNPIDFENFASTYNESEGAKYLQQTAAAAQNSSAAAKGGLLSGANLRGLTGITEGIANQDLLEQYKAEAAGQQQDFQQRETSYQNLYGQEAMGLQAGIAEAGTYAQGARAVGSLYGTQASNAQSSSSGFGSALGTIFKGITSLFPGAAVAAA